MSTPSSLKRYAGKKFRGGSDTKLWVNQWLANECQALREAAFDDLLAVEAGADASAGPQASKRGPGQPEPQWMLALESESVTTFKGAGLAAMLAPAGSRGWCAVPVRSASRAQPC